MASATIIGIDLIAPGLPNRPARRIIEVSPIESRPNGGIIIG